MESSSGAVCCPSCSSLVELPANFCDECGARLRPVEMPGQPASSERWNPIPTADVVTIPAAGMKGVDEESLLAESILREELNEIAFVVATLRGEGTETEYAASLDGIRREQDANRARARFLLGKYKAAAG